MGRNIMITGEKLMDSNYIPQPQTAWVQAPQQQQAITLSAPKESRKNRNGWWLVDLSDISKTILEAGKAYRQELLMHQRRRCDNPTELVKLFYLDYLTASRIGEPLKKPIYAKRLIMDGWTIVKTSKINEKHFTSTGEPQMMTQNLPVRTQPDKEMWDYVFEGGAYGWERTFDFSPLATYAQRTRITEAFKNNFKTDLTDGERIYKRAGIAPHILRHLRVYNLKFNQGYDDSLVQSFLG